MTPPAASTPPVILHVDMDAFFASVEVLDDPSLKGKPVIVGGDSRRGVVASCSYEARVFGVHSAMPAMRAKRLCPNAIFLNGHYDRYVEMSEQVHEVFRSFTPLVESLGLDEAFLDVTGAQRLFGSGTEVGQRIREEMVRRLALDCCVGVSTVKFIAKMASVAAKPKVDGNKVIPGPGVFEVKPGEELAFLHPQPIRRLWGVGPAMASRLARFGIETIGDIADTPLESLTSSLGPSNGQHLYNLAWGIDEREVVTERGAKSVGHEETYAQDLVDLVEIEREALRLSDAVCSRLRAQASVGRTITLKVRAPDFTTVTRSKSLPEAVDRAEDVYDVAKALLQKVDLAPGVRLLGVSVSNLESKPTEQLSLDEVDGKGSVGTDVIDAVRRRFGSDALGPATLLGRGGMRVKRRGAQQWGPTES